MALEQTGISAGAEKRNEQIMKAFFKNDLKWQESVRKWHYTLLMRVYVDRPIYGKIVYTLIYICENRLHFDSKCSYA